MDEPTHVVVFYRTAPDGQFLESRIVQDLDPLKARAYLTNLSQGHGFVIGTRAYAPGYWQWAQSFTAADFAEDVRRNAGPF